MLAFKLYLDDEPRSDRTVHVDPVAVACVEESERRRAYGGWSNVAVITLNTGKEIVVYDSARMVAQDIMAVKQSLRTEA